MFTKRRDYIQMMDQLTQYALNELGFGPLGEIRILTDGSSNSHLYFRDKIENANLYTNTYKAEKAMVTKRNDVLLVDASSHLWYGDLNVATATLTWAKECCHMLGIAPGSMGGYQRARFSHAGSAMANFFTVSGNGNKFKNLRWMHGAASGGAADVTCLTLTGSGNVFEDCAFAGPNDATQAASANYASVVLSGSQNYFKKCVFGTSNAVSRTGANTILKFLADPTSGTIGSMNVFEDCIFNSRAGDGNPYFINDLSANATAGFDGIFRNCTFLNSGTALTVAILKAAQTGRKLFFDSRCTFAGVTDVVADARVAEVQWGGGGASPDVTAIADGLALGLAQPVNAS